eukprot:TRINITY_DN51901_c0_g1_i1.p1 TRINITY_DN51901_c0_g1~~TRINITY_DN51901_c0_g1_i1.p1  ORF type:complete len:619 (+),score=91.27 TRINITY_DN51901_c0_g1_i1:110-1858(+)
MASGRPTSFSPGCSSTVASSKSATGSRSLTVPSAASQASTSLSVISARRRPSLLGAELQATLGLDDAAAENLIRFLRTLPASELRKRVTKLQTPAPGSAATLKPRITTDWETGRNVPTQGLGIARNQVLALTCPATAGSTQDAPLALLPPDAPPQPPPEPTYTPRTFRALQAESSSLETLESALEALIMSELGPSTLEWDNNLCGLAAMRCVSTRFAVSLERELYLRCRNFHYTDGVFEARAQWTLGGRRSVSLRHDPGRWMVNFFCVDRHANWVKTLDLKQAPCKAIQHPALQAALAESMPNLVEIVLPVHGWSEPAQRNRIVRTISSTVSISFRDRNSDLSRSSRLHQACPSAPPRAIPRVTQASPRHEQADVGPSFSQSQSQSFAQSQGTSEAQVFLKDFFANWGRVSLSDKARIHTHVREGAAAGLFPSRTGRQWAWEVNNAEQLSTVRSHLSALRRELPHLRLRETPSSSGSSLPVPSLRANGTTVPQQVCQNQVGVNQELETETNSTESTREVNERVSSNCDLNLQSETSSSLSESFRKDKDVGQSDSLSTEAPQSDSFTSEVPQSEAEASQSEAT